MVSTVAVWPTVALGEVLRKSEAWEDINPDTEYAQVTVRLWGKGVALRGRVLGNQIAASRQLVVHTNQFILSRIDARNGAFGLVTSELDGAVVSSDFPVFNLDESRIVPAYLDWMSKTHDFVEMCQRASEGTTNRVRLKEEQFIAATIPLPPLDKQRRIVARIEALAARIAEARGLRQAAMAEATTWVSSMHLMLAGSRTAKLADILLLDEHHVDVLPGEQYPQVGLRGFGGGLFYRETIEATQTTYRSFNRLYSGAIVLSQVKGWEGAIAGCGPEHAGLFASPEYRTFRCILDSALPAYMAELVVTPWFWNQLKDLTRGVGARRERTRPEQFLELEIPMPELDKQTMALEAFGHLSRLRAIQAESIPELDALMPSLLDKAFRGEL